MTEVNPADPRWQLVQQVVHSIQFEKSHRLKSFLLFVCERELTGRRGEISEQEIGVQVFGRSAGYNPGDDSIVRSQARILRQRLAEYFTAVGFTAGMRIDIPKGSYVPVFELIDEPTVPEPDLVDEPIPSEATPAVWRRRSIGVSLLCLVVVTGLCSLYFVRHAKRQVDPETRFWNALLRTKRTPVIVPADSTLVIIEELTGSQVSFDTYQSRQYLASPVLTRIGGNLSAADLDQSQYTSMADLNLVARLMNVPQTSTVQPAIRYARDLSISDAREDNLILIGGARANPWVQLFAGKMNFAVDYDWQTKKNAVTNKTPRPGESPVYLQESSDPTHRVYGLIAYESSLDGEGESLLVAGTSSAGTQAAGDFLLSSHQFGHFLRQIQAPDGSIPHFELLLGARDLNGAVAGSTILAYRLTQ